jgi:hypothetical protein
MKVVILIVKTGLCIARVLIIFNLPLQFSQHPHSLAYIEWFTALSNPDTVLGMYNI